VVAPHGAGLVNLLWCYPKTKIVEFQDAKMLTKKVYPLLAHHLDLEHKTYTTDTIPVATEEGKKPIGVKRKTDLINFKLDITKLLEFFRKENIV
jgi:capsular polysaccharide biosynthesis protein